MANAPRSKRAVSATRVVADDNDAVVADVVESNYGLKLTQALEAISAAEARSADYSGVAASRRFGRTAPQSLDAEAYMPTAEAAPLPLAQTAAPSAQAELVRELVSEMPAPVAKSAKPAAKRRTKRAAAAALPSAPATEEILDSHDTEPKAGATWLQTLDKLPPIKLPIGPAIPWRLGLPLLVGAVALMLFVGRPGAAAPEDRPGGVRLPAQETYAVQSQSPLFAASQQTTEGQPAAAQPVEGGAVAQPSQPAAIAQPESNNFGSDILDVGLKLVAVLALAYGSMMLLKRFGSGNLQLAGSGVKAPGVRVVTSLSLGQNRSVHVLRVNNGKTLLVGATPAQVNLIADLGDLSDEDVPTDAASFFDILSAKLPK